MLSGSVSFFVLLSDMSSTVLLLEVLGNVGRSRHDKSVRPFQVRSARPEARSAAMGARYTCWRSAARNALDVPPHFCRSKHVQCICISRLGACFPALVIIPSYTCNSSLLSMCALHKSWTNYRCHCGSRQLPERGGLSQAAWHPSAVMPWYLNGAVVGIDLI